MDDQRSSTLNFTVSAVSVPRTLTIHLGTREHGFESFVFVYDGQNVTIRAEELFAALSQNEKTA